MRLETSRRKLDPEDPQVLRQKRIDGLRADLEALSTERVEQCNLCGSSYFTEIATADRYRLAPRTALCNSCGLVFLETRPDAEGYAEFYRRLYRPLIAAYTGGEPTSTDAAAKERYAARVAQSLAPWLSLCHDGQALDLGAGEGQVAQALADRFDLHTLSVEPSPDEAAAARRSGLEVVEALAEDFDPGKRRFDLVLLCRSIDHFLDISGVLSKIHEWLRDDGLFFVDPLDFAAVLHGQSHLANALKIDHPYYLTRETTELYLRKTGFEPLRIVSTGNPFHLGFVCRKRAPRALGEMSEGARRAWERIRARQFWQPPPQPGLATRFDRALTRWARRLARS